MTGGTNEKTVTDKIHACQIINEKIYSKTLEKGYQLALLLKGSLLYDAILPKTQSATGKQSKQLYYIFHSH